MSCSKKIDYECFRILITELQIYGHHELAKKLDFMLNRVAWTTGSELLGEIGLELQQFQRDAKSIDASLLKALDNAIEMVNRI